MTLPPFALHRPRSLDEVEDLLEQHGGDAVVYCGGTELLLVMKLGLAAYPNLVDLKGIPELHVLEERDGRLCVGAAVTHRELESSPFVHGLFPALAEMERRVANVRVRSVGTLGGNLCFSVQSASSCVDPTRPRSARMSFSPRFASRCSLREPLLSCTRNSPRTSDQP